MCKTSLNFRVSVFWKRVVVWMVLTIFIGILTPVVSVAQQPTPTATLAPGEFIASKIEDLVGIWESQYMGAVAYMQYKADGTFNLAYTIEKLKTAPIAYGTFWFEGTVFNTKDNLCPKGSYEVRVQKEGDRPIHLSFTVIDDPSCFGRVQDLPKGMTRVEPSLQVSKKEEIPPRRLDEQYLIYLPEEYEEQQKIWPLLLFLHGLGERGNNLELVKKHGPPKLVEQGKDFPFIIVSPQCREDRVWSTPLSVEFLDKVLNEVTERYRVDEDRVYVTGLSLGGFGTWTLALAYPDRFAAIAPICGGGDPEKAELIKHLPVWVFHGANDETVSIEQSQVMVDALERVGGNVKFTVYPEAGHDVWTETYDNPELYEWFLKHQREK